MSIDIEYAPSMFQLLFDPYASVQLLLQDVKTIGFYRYKYNYESDVKER